ncbi:MAG: septal ring lytic transglycosylase RlpA family protein [Saprospiraceae bacterium]|nr:septal ring lytic transglycosylase RlpA family protein [Saprospiraceae bacterium]MDW8483716.1 septal ring lytic transglycosylase RlpA family protein [Saprospiraceae bacterium]
MLLQHNGFALVPCFVISFLSILAQGARFEIGKCGYYADSFHGKKTASDEAYDKNLLTAAHKSHPFGTILRVTRLDNKKSVDVRVNDRGPYLNGYIVDVSGRAAKLLGLDRDGVAKVKVEVIEPTITNDTTPQRSFSKPTSRVTIPTASSASRDTAAKRKKPFAADTEFRPTPSPRPIAYENQSPPPSNILSTSQAYQISIYSVPSGTFGVQLVSFSSYDFLFNEVQKIHSKWPNQVILKHVKINYRDVFKIIIGPFSSRKEAENFQKSVAKKGYPQSFVVEFY